MILLYQKRYIDFSYILFCADSQAGTWKSTQLVIPDAESSAMDGNLLAHRGLIEEKANIQSTVSHPCDWIPASLPV